MPLLPKHKILSLLFLLLVTPAFAQKKVKSVKAVYYSVLRDKLGLEKKRKMQSVDYIIKYDTLGNEAEEINYGETSCAYSENGVGCSWNYKI